MLFILTKNSVHDMIFGISYTSNGFMCSVHLAKYKTIFMPECKGDVTAVKYEFRDQGP
jgi:hypothetical protein